MFTEEDLRRLEQKEGYGVNDQTTASPKKKPKKVDYIIGIDPGSNTGLAVWDPSSQRLAHVDLTTFWGCVEYIESLLNVGLVVEVYLEDPSQARFTYARNSMGGARGARINRNVGKNQRDAELLRERFEEETTLHAIPPQVGKGASKWSAKRIESVLGYPPAPQNPFPNNEHVRDALKLLFTHRVIGQDALSYLQDHKESDKS